VYIYIIKATRNSKRRHEEWKCILLREKKVILPESEDGYSAYLKGGKHRTKSECKKKKGEREREGLWKRNL